MTSLFARERELPCWYPKFSCAFAPTPKLQMAFVQQKESGKHLQPGKLICSLLLPWERNSLCYNRELVFASVNKITSETPRREKTLKSKKSFMNLLCCQDSAMQTDAASPSTDSAEETQWSPKQTCAIKNDSRERGVQPHIAGTHPDF